MIGVIDVRTVTGPGDQKMSAGMGLAFVFIPLSLLFAITLAIMTCVRWRGASKADRLRGLIPLSFPVLGFLLACVP